MKTFLQRITLSTQEKAPDFQIKRHPLTTLYESLRWRPQGGNQETHIVAADGLMPS